MLQDLFNAYAKAGGERSMAGFFDPMSGLVKVVWNGTKATVVHWDKRLEKKFGLVAPDEAKLTKALAAEHKAIVAGRDFTVDEFGDKIVPPTAPGA
jgi:hypothetical protein